MIFDTHAHYDDEAYDVDRNEILGTFVDNHVDLVVNVAAGMKSVRTTLKLIKQYDFIYGALGIHPCECKDLTEEDILFIRDQVLAGKYQVETSGHEEPVRQVEIPSQHNNKKHKIVAIGEIGLDYYWDDAPKDVQKKWFLRQLDLAREVDLPVIIHSRDAAKETYDILKQEHAEKIGGVVHCYSYTKEMARLFLEMDLFFGIGGVITFSNAKKLKEAVEYIPLLNIVLETDAPYLAPVPNRGKRNSSTNLSFVANEIATIKGITYDEVIEATYHNAKRLYRMK